MKLEEISGKSILVLGLGREGLATLHFLAKHFPNQKVAVADQVEKILGEKNIGKRYFGKGYLDEVDQYDVTIKSPGISPHLPKLEKAYKMGKVITSGTALFLSNCPGRVIGVTGTKGKSTTSSVIFEVLKNGGFKTKLIGNIGIPALDFLDEKDKETIFVFELSSHQLYDLEKSPQIAVMTNLYPEHLDYYQNFQEYKNAKANITKFQTNNDLFIFNQEEKALLEIAPKSKALKLPFSLKEKENSVVFKKGPWIVYRTNNQKEEIIKTKEVPLLGEFNLLNIMPAVIIGKTLKIPTSKIRKAIRNFQSLPHRLEFVGRYHGISFYDDSISTIPQTAAAAIEALGEEVETLICGGYDRKIDFTPLAKTILKSNIKNLILFPTTGSKIWQTLLKQKSPQSLKLKQFNTASMEEAVKIAFQNTSQEKICLLSPASSSFNLFRDYEERGNLFKEYIKNF